MPLIEPIEIVPKSGTRTTDGGPAPTIERHPDFYFDESPVIIKVENKLFKVHKYHLLESETFSDMFKIPKGASNEIEEGSSPEHPIVLDGVSSSDFEALLKVLYARLFSNIQPSPDASLIVPAFRLAHMWNFADLRSHLFPLVEKVLGDVDKIVLARDLGIKEWLAPAYVGLCQRPEPLNIEESTKLGMHSLLMIFHMREQFRPPSPATSLNVGQYYCYNCVGVSYHSNSAYYCTGSGCNTTQARFRVEKNKAGTSGLNVNKVDLETRVKKWVEDGCVFAK